jgi:hypothetical protein
MPVLSRHKDYDLMPSHVVDFTLGAAAPFDAEELARNPAYSLYCVEPDTREAVFVETPATLDLTDFPFLFVAQFRHATHVVTVPFDALHGVAAAIPPPADDLILVHSVGRCGSTLVSRAFAALPGVCSLAEPDAITQLTAWRFDRRSHAGELMRLVDSCVRLYCKPMAGMSQPTHYVMKFRAQCIEIADLLHRAFPSARQVYITREPLDWLQSAWQAFVVPQDMGRPATVALLEDAFARVHPLIRSLQVPGQPMPIWKTWMLVWIANTETHARLRAGGMDFHELNYRSLQTDPVETIAALFTACSLTEYDRDVLVRCVKDDSQAGSIVARSEVRKSGGSLPSGIRELAKVLLRERGHLHGR